MTAKTLLLLMPLLLAATGAWADPPGAPGDEKKDAPAGEPGKSAKQKYDDAVAAEVARGWVRAPVDEQETVTRHAVGVGGESIPYQATAGTLTLRDDRARPMASIFYVAYTRTGADRRTRPVTFFWNGGPGSSSIWLHMGSFAPVRVATGSPETIKPPPYDFGPNPYTLLDKTDPVFIDAPGAGYSRTLGDVPEKDLWGVDQDADAFAKAIQRWLVKNSRWTSPKFLFGESYGTTRAAAVAYQLQDRGVALNGVILLSSILNLGIDQSGFDESYIAYLPSFAATAWYHKRLKDRPPELAPFLAQARAFAIGPYAAALAKGNRITPAEAQAIAEQVSNYTGLSVDFIRRANLRVDLNRFQKELLRDQRQTVGRFDSRYLGVDPDAAGESPEYDAADTAISGAFIATFNDYLRSELNFKTDLPYRIAAYGLKDFDWDWKHKAPAQGWPQNNPNVGVDLAAAMRTNPYLHVLSLNGYYDMATPFAATEYDLSHMPLEPAAVQRVEYRYYASGHMIYLNPDALKQLKSDLAAFYDESLARVPVPAPGPVRP